MEALPAFKWHPIHVTFICWAVLFPILSVDKWLRGRGKDTRIWAMVCGMILALGGTLPWFLVGFGPGDGIGNGFILMAGLFIGAVSFGAIFAARSDD